MSVLLTEDHAGGVRLLTLNRPSNHVFDVELMQALSAAVKRAADDDAVRALVLRGAGPVFSAGLDFRALTQAVAAGGFEHFGESMNRAFFALWTCPKPTVAAVTGHAIAAGFFVAVACDFRHVLEGPGRYGMNELAFGAGFSAVSLEIGRHALQHHMAYAIQNAELFDWREGLRNGSFHASHRDEEALLAAALARAAKTGAMPREAYAHVKARLLLPYVERVLAESEEQKRRSAAIYRSAETLRAMQSYVAGVLSGARGGAAR